MLIALLFSVNMTVRRFAKEQKRSPITLNWNELISAEKKLIEGQQRRRFQRNRRKGIKSLLMYLGSVVMWHRENCVVSVGVVCNCTPLAWQAHHHLLPWASVISFTSHSPSSCHLLSLHMTTPLPPPHPPSLFPLTFCSISNSYLFTSASSSSSLKAFYLPFRESESEREGREEVGDDKDVERKKKKDQEWSVMCKTRAAFTP